MQRFQFLKLAAAAVIAVPLLLSGCGDKKTAELKVGATAAFQFIPVLRQVLKMCKKKVIPL